MSAGDRHGHSSRTAPQQRASALPGGELIVLLDDRGSLAAMAQAVSACDPDPEWKERILRGMTLVAMFDGNPDPQTLTLLDAAAKAFGVDARPVTTYSNVMLDRQTIVRFEIARRGFLRQAIEATVRDGGLPAFVSNLKVLSGHGDRAMVERLQTVGDDPALRATSRAAVSAIADRKCACADRRSQACDLQQIV